KQIWRKTVQLLSGRRIGGVPQRSLTEATMASTRKGGAPPRTSMRGAEGQIGSRISGRAGTRHGTNRGQKQQSQWQSENEASPTLKRATWRDDTRNRPRDREEPSQSPGGNKPSQTQGRLAGSVRSRSARDFAERPHAS